MWLLLSPWQVQPGARQNVYPTNIQTHRHIDTADHTDCHSPGCTHTGLAHCTSTDNSVPSSPQSGTDSSSSLVQARTHTPPGSPAAVCTHTPDKHGLGQTQTLPPAADTWAVSPGPAPAASTEPLTRPHPTAARLGTHTIPTPGAGG